MARSPAAGNTPHAKIKLDGADLDAAVLSVLTEAVVDERFGSAAVCHLRFQDNEIDSGDAVLSKGRFDIGKKLKVEMGWDSTGVVFEGEITALEVDYREDGQTDTIVRAMDAAWALMRGRETKVFKQVRYSDVVSQIASAAGMQATVDSTRETHDYILQHQQSNWEFISELAREVGYEVRTDGTKLEFKKTGKTGSPVVELERGVNLKRLSIRETAAQQVEKVEVWGWDPKQKKEVMQTASVSSSEWTSQSVPAGKHREKGTKVLTGTATPYRTTDGASAAVKAEAAAVATAALELNGETYGTPELRVGVTVKLGRLGSRFDGSYRVTTVRHLFDPADGYRTEFGVATPQRSSLHALAGGNGNGNGAAGSVPVPGMVTALVTDVKDPDDMGRVKVKYPWMGADIESDWGRVSQLSTGDKYGALWMPEVNEEVLVTFVHGDVRQPVILGSLYNGKDKAEKGASDYFKSSKVVQRGFVTPKKNRLMFVDEQGKEEVLLSSGDDKYVLNLSKTATTIKIDSDGTVEIKAKKNVTIESDQGITMKAKQDIKLESNANIELKATGNLKAEATANMDLKSNAQLNVQTSGMGSFKSNGVLELNGSLVKIN